MTAATTSASAAKFLAMVTPQARQEQARKYEAQQEAQREELARRRRLRGQTWQPPTITSSAAPSPAPKAEQSARQRAHSQQPTDFAALITPEAREQAQRQHLAREDAQRLKNELTRAKWRKFAGEQTAPPAPNPFSELAQAVRDGKSPQEALQGPAQPAPTQIPTRGHRKAPRGPQRPAAPEAPPLDELLTLSDFVCKRGRGAGGEGAGKLARLLDDIARRTMQARKYGSLPNQIILHLPQELLAAELGANPATVWRWSQELAAVGYLEARTHYGSRTTKGGDRVTATTGTLYAVRLRPDHMAHLSHDDLAHQWRDLDADKAAGRGSFKALLAHSVKNKEISESVKMQDTTTLQVSDIRKTLYMWAVTPGYIYSIPVNNCILHFPASPQATPAEAAPAALQQVAQGLPAVEAADTRSRPKIINDLAGQLAQAINDNHSRAAWAGIMWQAHELGRVQVLAAQITRAAADFAEWDGINNPAAWLMARVRPQATEPLPHAAD